MGLVSSIALGAVGTTLIAAGVVLGVALFVLWRRRRNRERIVALVLFLRKPRPLDPEDVRRVIARALGREMGEVPGALVGTRALELLFSPQGPDFVFFPPGPAPVCEGASHCLAKAGPHVFLLNSVPMPYSKDLDGLARSVPDLRIQKAVREHTAWLSIDVLHPDQERDMKEAYRHLGRIAAELADEDCLALYATETGNINACGPALYAALRSDNPMEAFRPVDPVVPVPDDDEALAAATREARSRWPEFVRAFEQRSEGWHYSVKAPFVEGEVVEHMWTTVEAIEGGIVVGVLDNDPANLMKLRCGDRVRVKKADVEDWVYADGKTMRGAFSMKAVERERDRYRGGAGKS